MKNQPRNQERADGRLASQSRFRLIVQIAATALANGYAIGYAKGAIFTGPTKAVCVPVLNCYSCPGALGACPIGALQAVIGRSRQIPFYVLGSIMLFGVVLGRLICGFLCPFGLFQDLLHKIPVPKKKMPARLDKPLRYLKYGILLVLVILMPALAVGPYGSAPPFFCELVCPAGTLGAGFPLVLANPSLRAGIGFLFGWKSAVLIAIVIASTLISRPFCKYLCPLGALYSLFNRFSFYQMDLDRAKCIDCKRCERHCPMEVPVTEDINNAECIRCGRCAAVCPVDAISSGFGLTPQSLEQGKAE